MKNRVFTITASILSAFCFVQFASSSSLSATCTNVNENSDSALVVQVAVSEDWQSAAVFSPELPESVLNLPCNGQKSGAEDFKCYFSLTDDVNGCGYLVKVEATFIRDSEKNMNLTLLSDVSNDSTHTIETEVYKCVANS